MPRCLNIDPLLFHIAEYYDKAPRTDPAAAGPYLKLANWIEHQFEKVTDVVEVWFTQFDPYKNAREMFEEINACGILRVFSKGNAHPLLSREQNNRLRAIHDYFGHYIGEAPFSLGGEVSAWRATDRLTYDPEVSAALTTEFLGQTAWFHYGPFNYYSPKERPFPPQKAILIPRELWTLLI